MSGITGMTIGDEVASMRPLLNHFENVRLTLLQKANEAGFATHSTVRGTARELIISDFFAANLPATCRFLKGEVIDSLDRRSGELDVVVIPSGAPRFSLAGDTAIAIADGVVATAEVKSKLTTAEIGSESALKASLELAKRVKSLKIEAKPWPWAAKVDRKPVKLSSIPVSVIAFEGPPRQTLLKKLVEWRASYPVSQLPDTISVLDQGYTLVRNNGWVYPRQLISPNPNALYYWIEEPGSCLGSLFNYLMYSIQAWDHRNPKTPFSAFLRPLKGTQR